MFRRGGGICPKCEKEYLKLWRKSNKEKTDAARKRWKDANPEKERAHQKRYYKSNSKKVIENARRWGEANPEKKKEYAKQWRKSHPEERIAWEQARRARISGNGGKFTPREWKDLCNYYGNKCLCCGRSDLKLTADHVIPIKLGGVNSIENLQPLCKSCNSKKNTHTIDYRKNERSVESP